MPRIGKKTLRPFRLRRFLNKTDASSDAFVSISIGMSYEHVKVKITDCDRVVALHNQFGTMKERANTLYKLRTLRDSVDEAVQHLEAEVKRNHWRVAKL